MTEDWHRIMAEHAEEMRVQRWWDTYNAALALLVITSNEPCLSDDWPAIESYRESAERLHKIASMQATIAHGPLEKKP